MIRILAVLATLMCVAPALAQPLPAGTDPQNTLILETKNGRVVIKLRPDLAPKHAERLKQLTREKFYDNVPFHRVIAGFMAQTGDGQYGNGTGGSKYPNLPAEFTNVPFKRGIVGMARTAAILGANKVAAVRLMTGEEIPCDYVILATGVRPNLNLLYALEAALLGLRWDRLPDVVKANLRERAGADASDAPRRRRRDG